MKNLTPERLTRLLAMITYFADGRAVPFSEAAHHFGISQSQLLKDINTLWVSGAPGYTHADLIDFEASALEEGVVRLREAQNMDRPLRLAPVEAVTLLVALDSLIARLGEEEVLVSTRQKLHQAAGQAAHAAEAVRMNRTPQETLAVRHDIDTAISQGKQIWLRYVSGVDKISERLIDPLTLFISGEHWVVGAWCHQAQSHRRFRLDRVLSLRIEESPVGHHPPADFPDFDSSAFSHHATLWLKPQARWLLEQVPVDQVINHSEYVQVEISAADPDWLERLCLRLGDSLLGVSPEDLSQRVRDRARAALEHYDE